MIDCVIIKLFSLEENMSAIGDASVLPTVPEVKQTTKGVERAVAKRILTEERKEESKEIDEERVLPGDDVHIPRPGQGILDAVFLSE